MGDYGFRISKAGVDVKTGADKDMIITSKYPNLKGSLSGFGTKTVISGDTDIIAIAHGLGYTPFVKTFINPIDSIDFPNVYNQMPFYSDGPTDHLYTFSYADATNVYISIFQWNSSSISGDNRTYNYKYFIFIDKGKL